MRRWSDDRHKLGFGVQPQFKFMTCPVPGFGAEPGRIPGLMTCQTRACDGRRAVVASSSCRQAVVMPSVYHRRAVGTSSSCCRAIVVRPSAHCCRAVVSIVISTRRDFSYPTSACLLNYANIIIIVTYIYHLHLTIIMMVNRMISVNIYMYIYTS